MPRAGEHYKKLEKGIYAIYEGRKRVGLRAQVRVRGVLYNSPRWGPDTAVSVAKAWQDERRVEARKQPAPAPTSTSGFAADAKTYLAAVKAMASYSDRERDIEAWTAVFGHTPRELITAADIQAQLAKWRQGGAKDGKPLAASTVNHRRTALSHLYRTLDGKGARNPVAQIPKYREPDAEDRSLDDETVQAIFDAMDDTLTKARLMVIAYTGLPHVQIGRLTAKHFDLDAGVMTPPRRHKGGGSRLAAVPLTQNGVLALAALVRHDGVGKPFSNSSLHKSFRLACQKVQNETGRDLSDATPYDLRHSFGARLYRATGDQRAVQAMLQHARIDTTHRYTLGGVDARLRAVVDAVDRARSTTKVSSEVSTSEKDQKKA